MSSVKLQYNINLKTEFVCLENEPLGRLFEATCKTFSLEKDNDMKLIKSLGMVYDKKQNRNYKMGIYECPNCKRESTLYSSQVGQLCVDCSRVLNPMTHGMSKTKQYRVWAAMIKRTTNKKDARYEFYKDKVPPDKWFSFEGFWDDMGDGYKEGLSIDRINNDLPYSKNNCRWATQETQSQNTRKIRKSNTSGFRGVWYYKKLSKWGAGIQYDKIQKYLGVFDYPWTAAYAYDSYVLNNNLKHTINFNKKDL